MNKYIVFICFYFPLISSCLNFQGFVALFISTSISQKIAYFNVLLIIVGVFLFRRNFGKLSQTNKLWLLFYVIYYCFALLASGIQGFDSAILATLVAPIYFIGFYFLLSNPIHFKMFSKVLTVTLIISSFFTIYFYEINFSLDISGILNRDVDRAEGLYGDANNAALTSILAFLLLTTFYNPSLKIFKILKTFILLAIFYSIFITFSTTGLLTLIIVFFIINFKFFNGIRFLLFGVAIIIFYSGIFALKSQSKNLNLSKAQTAKVENLINVVTLDLDNINSSGRVDLLDNLVKYIYDNPIIGNGVGFGSALRGHNTYLLIWADAGLFSFLYFIFVLIYYLIKTLSLKLHMKLFTMSILVTLYIFMLSLQTVINQAYLIVLIAFVGYIIDNNNNNNNNNNTNTLENPIVD